MNLESSCFVCGGASFTQSIVLEDELIGDWRLSPNESDSKGVAAAESKLFIASAFDSLKLNSDFGSNLWWTL